MEYGAGCQPVFTQNVCSPPILSSYTYIYLIGVYTDRDNLILAALAQRTKDQYELNNVIALLSVGPIAFFCSIL